MSPAKETDRRPDLIPTSDLRHQYQTIKAEIDEAIDRVLRSGEFERGEELDSFEEAFAQYCGARHAVGVGSGYAALFLALKACGVGPGDEVITVANTDVATTAAIAHTGARHVWVDIDPRTYNIDPALIEEHVNPNTKAIVPVHLYGLPADMGPIMEIARKHDLIVVEDAALAVGARYDRKPIGGYSHAAAFSFAPHKILGAYGDGGAVVTNDPQIADRVRLLGSYGEQRAFEQIDGVSIHLPLYHLAEGYHNHLDTLQAAVLKTKLRHVDGWISRRQAIAAHYDAALAGTSVVTPYVPDRCTHVYRNYVVRVPNRDQVRRRMAAQGIATSVVYAPPLHVQPLYQGHCQGNCSLPVSETVAEEIVGLPMFPELTDEQIDRVISALREAIQ